YHMATDKRLRQRQNRTDNMAPINPNALAQGMAVPPHIAAQLMAQQQETPDLAEQRRQVAVHLAIASYQADAVADGETQTIDDDALIERAHRIAEFIAGADGVQVDEPT